jgi:hypothetical protein
MGLESEVGEVVECMHGQIVVNFPGGTRKLSQDLLKQVRSADPFTVMAITINGNAEEIGWLQSSDTFASLLAKVETAFGASAGCVQICSGEKVFSEEHLGKTLAELGICQTTIVTCVFRDAARVKLWLKVKAGNRATQYAAMRALLDHENSMGVHEVHDVVKFLDRIVQDAQWWKSGDAGREESEMYKQTVLALGKVGRDAAPAIPVLRRHVKDRHVSQAAAEAIGQMGSAGVAALRELVCLQSFNVPRLAALRALKHLGLAAVSAVPELELAASSLDFEVQSAAIDAIRAIRAFSVS